MNCVRCRVFLLSLAVTVLIGLPTSVLTGASVNCSAETQNQVQAWGPPYTYGYTDFETVVAILGETEFDHPDIARVYDLGDSWETTEGIADRDILAVKISDNPELDEGEPEVLIIARLHANEAPPTEIALQLIENLTDLYGSDARVSWLVDNREVWIIPVANPDGMDYAMTVDENWRKNRRLNYDDSYGVDLNRNFDGSQNGDPLGAWGGVGTSDDPTSVIYCGEAAFSEPETQAIRDLVMSHDFQIAIDYHYAANWIMWPWGYTEDPPADNVDLVRIGTEYADVAGYYASQSSIMYPTTGDSCDWLYGGADVYSFCVEVGGWWSQGEVLQDLPNNVLGSLLMIEAAGDREGAQFAIEHIPLEDTVCSVAGYEVAVEITSSREVDESAISLMYNMDDGAWSAVAMVRSEGTNTFTGVIPSLGGVGTVHYYVAARDVSGVELSSPRYAPYEVYSFVVVPDTEPPTARAGHNVVISVGEEMTLDASASDDNVGIVLYVWSLTYDGILTELYGMSQTFTFWVPGVYEVLLTVVDASGNCDTDSITVKVVDFGR